MRRFPPDTSFRLRAVGRDYAQWGTPHSQVSLIGKLSTPELQVITEPVNRSPEPDLYWHIVIQFFAGPELPVLVRDGDTVTVEGLIDRLITGARVEMPDVMADTFTDRTF